MSAPCNCGGAHSDRFPVIHHLPCAYVGPSYDFARSGEAFACPKCDIVFAASGRDSESLGYAFRCRDCGAEWLEETRG